MNQTAKPRPWLRPSNGQGRTATRPPRPTPLFRSFRQFAELMRQIASLCTSHASNCVKSQKSFVKLHEIASNCTELRRISSNCVSAPSRRARFQVSSLFHQLALRVAPFGFRISAFLRPLGLRISDLPRPLGLRISDLPRPLGLRISHLPRTLGPRISDLPRALGLRVRSFRASRPLVSRRHAIWLDGSARHPRHSRSL